MKAAPLIINWHDQNAPIYSAHFEPGGRGRLATGGGDNQVRLWKVDADGPDRQVEYLATLSKHNQAVNVVLASAGDDGNVILWVPSDTPPVNFGSERLDDKESWRAKHMCRSSGAEIYDLAWSPDAVHFIIGSMDNIARIYNASSGTLVRQVAEHSHYVQGVAWDPLNEYIATQSSDRSVHIYSLKTKDGQYTLSHDDKPPRLASHIKADLPPRRISSNSPAPPDFGHRAQVNVVDSATSVGSPVPSAPSTPTSFPLPMNPPSVVSHSRRTSFSSRRSASPAPSMPLPAVMPMETSPKPHHSIGAGLGLGMKNASLYANETLTSFFRRLTFTPDGSLLMTPAGQYQNQCQADKDAKPTFEVTNTVYIYTRGGINKPPIAHLPGHKKPSVVVKCSPIFYTLRQSSATKYITIDSSSAEDSLPSLGEPVSKPSPAPSVMDPPPPPAPAAASSESNSKPSVSETSASSTPGPKPAFSLPYRMVYAVATQDSVLLYDTQQKTPVCVVSNLHCATFTDLAWSSDGLTLIISSSDGFCSTLTFGVGELGDVYKGELVPSNPTTSHSTAHASIFTPPTALGSGGPQHGHRNSVSQTPGPLPSCVPPAGSQRPSSPTRSSSTSSVTTPSTTMPTGVLSNPVLISGSVPSITAANSSKVTGVSLTTPPETPGSTIGLKREASEGEDKPLEAKEPKKRRIAPTLVEPKP
ncbi:putative WD repeat-containing protein [Escovopsis weberi]|uniref:Putative WD repeat-containing protein n=1 Tax=Escovopsis weberi TaxID=150374 RepID=A0A0M8N1V6_ESCWE|nr:putative WD repeat-containing protein [Escovopsis weberi]